MEGKHDKRISRSNMLSENMINSTPIDCSGSFHKEEISWRVIFFAFFVFYFFL